MRRLTKIALGLLAGCSAAATYAQAPTSFAPPYPAAAEAPQPSYPPAAFQVGPQPFPQHAPPGLPPVGPDSAPEESLPQTILPLQTASYAIPPEGQPTKRNPNAVTPVVPTTPPPLYIPNAALGSQPGAPPPGTGIDVPMVGLAELSEIAQNNNPSLREAMYAMQAARGRAYQAGLYPNPVMQGGGSQINGSSSQWQLFGSQEVVVAHKLQLDRNAILQEARRLEFDWVLARFNLLSNLRKQYFTALSSQQRVATLESLVLLANQSRDTAERLQKAGEGARVDTILLEIELQRARMARDNSGAVLLGNKRALASLLGDPDAALPMLVPEWDRPLPMYEADPNLKEYVLRNSETQSAIVEIARQQTLLQRARVEPIPNITAIAGYQGSLADNKQDQGMFWLSLPIPTWNKNQGQIAAVQSEAARALYASRNIQVVIAGRLAEAMGRFVGAKRQVERYRESVLPLAREAFQITRKGYEEGQFDFLRLLQAQKALLEANLGYIQALEDCWVAGSEVSGILQLESFP